MAEPDGGTGKPGGGSGPDVSGAVNEEALESEAVEIVQEAVSPRPPGTGIEIGFLLIILGLALGATFSTFGVQLFSDYAPVMFSALLALVVVLILILASAFMFRRPMWGRQSPSARVGCPRGPPPAIP